MGLASLHRAIADKQTTTCTHYTELRGDHMRTGDSATPSGGPADMFCYTGFWIDTFTNGIGKPVSSQMNIQVIVFSQKRCTAHTDGFMALTTVLKSHQFALGTHPDVQLIVFSRTHQVPV
jgi:hypothetical protein